MQCTGRWAFVLVWSCGRTKTKWLHVAHIARNALACACEKCSRTQAPAGTRLCLASCRPLDAKQVAPTSRHAQASAGSQGPATRTLTFPGTISPRNNIENNRNSNGNNSNNNNNDERFAAPVWCWCVALLVLVCSAHAEAEVRVGGRRSRKLANLPAGKLESCRAAELRKLQNGSAAELGHGRA